MNIVHILLLPEQVMEHWGILRIAIAVKKGVWSTLCMELIAWPEHAMSVYFAQQTHRLECPQWFWLEGSA